jgi:dihydropyrimidinase
MMEYDLVIRNGTVVTATETAVFDIGVSEGRVSALARRLPGGTREIDASGLLVMPGGVDTHVHVEQRGNPEGPFTDTFFTATRSAACGGTTTILSHARQVKGESLAVSVADYTERARKAVVDYAFHLLVTDPNEAVLGQELPELIKAGHNSIKFFTASARNVLSDEQILRLMAVARKEGAFLLAHAENEAATNWLTEELVRSGKTHPHYNALAKPPAVEREAVHRVLAFAEIVDVPVQIFHVTSEEAVKEVERAQERGLQVYGETCVQYLVLTEADLHGPVEESVKFIFGPPPRQTQDQAALWRALKRGVLGMVSSDHAPFPYSGPGGKLEGVLKGGFATTPHGIPGLETRMALLFSAGVVPGLISPNEFVALTSTNPAKLFDLYPRKGSIVVGGDADIVIWDTGLEKTIRNDALHHQLEYTPYEGMKVRGWPKYTISRGEVILDAGEFTAEPGRGLWLDRRPRFRSARPPQQNGD